MDYKLPKGLNLVKINDDYHVITDQQNVELQAVTAEPDKSDPNWGKLNQFKSSNEFKHLMLKLTTPLVRANTYEY